MTQLILQVFASVKLTAKNYLTNHI